MLTEIPDGALLFPVLLNSQSAHTIGDKLVNVALRDRFRTQPEKCHYLWLAIAEEVERGLA